MKRNLSIQAKAAFLLLVFALNTVVGFACAVGLNMGFNTRHHHDEAITANTGHHHGDTGHHQDEADKDHHSKDSKDNCCKDKVVKFAQVDKTVPQSSGAGINPVFVTTFVASFFDVDISFVSKAIPNVKYFVRSYHPPIPDIRIAIQSFQI
jgi:hypothetical protein